MEGQQAAQYGPPLVPGNNLVQEAVIRAPPLAAKMTRGSFRFSAYSAARVTFSPTAVPILPMRKRLSRTTKTALWSSTLPRAATAASRRPVSSSRAFSFWG